MDEVKTVFKANTAEAVTAMEKMAETADRLDKSAQKASKQTANVPGSAGGGAVGANPSEQEMFKHDKELMKLRRARGRHEKLHLAQEQVLHRLGETALMAVIGSQNHLAEAFAKTGATMQGLGISTAGLGGKLGSLGGTLARMGGYAAMAGLAIEAGTAALELFGVDVNGLGHDIKNWALGIKHASRETAQMLGFRSEEDRTAAEAAKKKWNAEVFYSNTLRENAELMKTQAEHGDSSIKQRLVQDELHENMIELTKKVIKAGGALPGEDFAATMSRVETSINASADGWKRHAVREAELDKIEENAAKLIKAIPYEADAAAMAAHYEEVLKSVDEMARHRLITEEEKGAVAAGIAAQSEKRGAMQNELDAMRKSEVEHSLMAEGVKKMTKALKVINPKATADAQIKFNETFLNLAKEYAERYGIDTGPKMAEFLSMAKEASTEKQQRVYDFRNSRFDIKQAFADVDPDRVAVAFSNDLAALGERRVQSSFAPLWGV